MLFSFFQFLWRSHSSSCALLLRTCTARDLVDHHALQLHVPSQHKRASQATRKKQNFKTGSRHSFKLTVSGLHPLPSLLREEPRESTRFHGLSSAQTFPVPRFFCSVDCQECMKPQATSFLALIGKRTRTCEAAPSTCTSRRYRCEHARQVVRAYVRSRST